MRERRCATSPSPAAAIAVLEDWQPDILVTDLEMPGEDGVSLLRRARRMMTLRGRRLPALALTAYGRAEDRIRALGAGFNLHLGKPVEPGGAGAGGGEPGRPHGVGPGPGFFEAPENADKPGPV